MKNFDDKIKPIKMLLFVFCIIFIILSFMLPLHFKYAKNIAFTYGPSVIIVYISGAIYTIVATFFLLWNFKKIMDKRYIPIIFLITFGSICTFIQLKNPELLLTTAVHTFISFLMYFTIENPDIKMIEELSKMESRNEKSNEEKSNFIFMVTNNINTGLIKMENIYNNLKKLQPSDEVLYEVNNLKQVIDEYKIFTKETIDVSEIDSLVLKSINNQYNVSLLIKSIYYKEKQLINSDIDFRLNIGDMPNELYGDSIKIKQIIMSILDNSIKYTTKGFIELRANAIIKYDICRLIIVIEDSGIGMSMVTQSNILSDNGELNETEINDKDNSILNYKTIRKMINLIGGSLIINSELNKGTSVKIIINQKIVPQKVDKDLIKMEDYSLIINNKKKIGIISNNKEINKDLKKVFKNKKTIIEEFDMTLNCLNKLRNNVKYDYIFIDEHIDKIDAKSFYKKTRDINNIKTKMFVITYSNDFKIKQSYLNMGFNAVITLPINIKQLRDKFKNMD